MDRSNMLLNRTRWDYAKEVAFSAVELALKITLQGVGLMIVAGWFAGSPGWPASGLSFLDALCICAFIELLVDRLWPSLPDRHELGWSHTEELVRSLKKTLRSEAVWLGLAGILSHVL